MSDGVKEGAYFAWVRGLRGPTPVVYHNGINSSEMKQVLVYHELTSDMVQGLGAGHLEIKDLVAAFPPVVAFDDGRVVALEDMSDDAISR